MSAQVDVDMAYAARHTCGRIVAITVDRPEYQRDVAKFVASHIRLGLAVERMSVEQFRNDETPMCQCFRTRARKAGETQPDLPLSETP